MNTKIRVKLKLADYIDTQVLIVGDRPIKKHEEIIQFNKPRQVASVRAAIAKGYVIDVENFFSEADAVVAALEVAPSVVEPATKETVKEVIEEIIKEVVEEVVEAEKEEEAAPPDNFFCPVKGCERHTDGYAREGDLKRHIKKEHPELA